MKRKTLEQVARTKDKAARFVRNVLQDEDKAQDIEAESVESYAARKHLEIVEEPERKNRMASPTKEELIEMQNEFGDKVGSLLNPVLTREQIVEGLQELDEMINPDDDEDDEEDEEE